MAESFQQSASRIARLQEIERAEYRYRARLAAMGSSAVERSRPLRRSNSRDAVKNGGDHYERVLKRVVDKEAALRHRNKDDGVTHAYRRTRDNHHESHHD